MRQSCDTCRKLQLQKPLLTARILSPYSSSEQHQCLLEEDLICLPSRRPVVGMETTCLWHRGSQLDHLSLCTDLKQRAEVQPISIYEGLPEPALCGRRISSACGLNGSSVVWFELRMTTLQSLFYKKLGLIRFLPILRKVRCHLPFSISM